MGYYLNSMSAYSLYQNETRKPYFIDKTKMLPELFPLIESGSNYICLTRPRRFGKTVMANMIVSYFGKGADSSSIFQHLDVAQSDAFLQHLNQYDIIHISFNEMPARCSSYEQYIERIEQRLLRDIQQFAPHIQIEKSDAVWDALYAVYEQKHQSRFIFVLDEWDYIFNQDFVTEQDKKMYLSFLRNLLKDKAYVQFAYMTGILPIAKYSSGSELNMFLEYTMVTEERFSDYFGFTEAEVDQLYARYLTHTDNCKISRDGLRIWYNGYHTKSGDRVYNPRSVVASLDNNNLGNYWTNSGPYDEIYYYIERNVADVRNDLALMVSGIPVPARIQEYAATSMNLQTRDEIFSAMVVYGFLSYEKGKVNIPNRELMNKFTDMLRKEPSLGYLNRLAKASERMLQATLHGDTDTMQEILAFAHNTETPLLSYNSEIELTAIINLVYLSARDTYRIEREDKAGIGYVDFIFYPEVDKSADCMILELKMDAAPEQAIRQIRERQYALKFQPRLGEPPIYTRRILAIGISYNKQTKQHLCRIEIL